MIIKNKNFIFFLLLNILFYIVLFFINFTYYKNSYYLTYIPASLSLATVILAIGAGFNLISYNIGKKEDEVKLHLSFGEKYINNIINLFINHPEMNYLYEELFYNKITTNAKRNYILENQLCLLIITTTTEQLIVLNLYKKDKSFIFIKDTLIQILKLFFKSPIFRNFYINSYKNYLGNSLVINFMEQNFNI